MPEPVYHLQSLSLAMVCASAVTFACLAPALFRFPAEFRASMRTWIIGTALVVFADVVFFVGVEAPWAQTAMLAVAALGAAEWIHALRLYNGRARRAAWPYAVIAIGAAASFAAPSYPMTVLVTSLLYATLYLGAARAAASIREPVRSTGRILLVAVFAAIALVMAARLGLFVSGLRSGAAQGFTTPPRALMFILASVAPIAASFAFVLACGERLGDRLLRWSLTDALTGIPNRRAFLDSLERAVSNGLRRSEPVAVLVIDVDYFKRVNDTAGHATGDAALIAVAQLLSAATRGEDTLGRLGGEEFGVVAPGANLASATLVAERLRESIAAAPVVVDGRSFELSVSIGVAVTSAGLSDASSLLSRADALLYQAKGRGRNQVVTTLLDAGDE
jgi:diguanylate cyclase (GGDEF)-like protein